MLYESAQLLGLDPAHPITTESLKKAYLKSAKENHPDAGGSEELMKLVNAAKDHLTRALETSNPLIIEEPKYKNGDSMVRDYPAELRAALEWVLKSGLEHEITGMWLWVWGDTKPLRKELSAHKFRWAKQKKRWYFRPASWKSKGRGSWDMERIRDTYGSTTAKENEKRQLTNLKNFPAA